MGNSQERGNVPPISEFAKRVDRITNNPDFWGGFDLKNLGEHATLSSDDVDVQVFQIPGLLKRRVTDEIIQREKESGPIRSEELLRTMGPEVSVDEALHNELVREVIDDAHNRGRLVGVTALPGQLKLQITKHPKEAATVGIAIATGATFYLLRHVFQERAKQRRK